MTEDCDFQASLRERDALVDQSRPILARQSPEVAGTTHAAFLRSDPTNKSVGCWPAVCRACNGGARLSVVLRGAEWAAHATQTGPLPH